MRRSCYLISLTLLLLVSSVPAARAAGWLEYEGTFQEVTFSGGQRSTQARRLELEVPGAQAIPSVGPGKRSLGAIRISDPADRTRQQEYGITNAYVSAGIGVYVSSSGKTTLVLILHDPQLKEARLYDGPMAARLLMTGTEGAITVMGTYHSSRRPKHTP